jgi:hypothetical protein
MRKTILAASLSLGLSGCAGLQQDITAAGPTIAAVQQVAVSLCGFLPTASTIAGILSGGSPLVSTAEAVASAICAAVTPASAGGTRLGASRPHVGGVPVHGRFVR